jgi:hypothetical protein
MNKLTGFSKWLHQKISPSILLISIIAFGMFMLIVLPGVSETTKEITGTSSSPDTSFFYTSQDLSDIAESYGEAGRAYYIRSRFTFDIIWPIVYLFFLVSILTFLFKNTLNLIPFLGALFDLLENLGASFVMYRYPLDAGLITSLTPIFTLMKWIFIYISFGLIIIGLIRLFFNRLLMKPN